MTSDNPLAGLKFLLVEDLELNRTIAKTLIVSCGGKVEESVDGDAAVERFRISAKGEFAAILMDIRMPIMDGWKATEAIRALNHPDAQIIPIIAVTSEDTAEDIKRCFDSGMNFYLEKPYQPQDLIKTICQAIRSAHRIN